MTKLGPQEEVRYFSQKTVFTGKLTRVGCGKMAKKALVNNKKYAGKYVAFCSSDSKKVIASGSNPATVIKKARSQGENIPAIVFVPKEDVAYIY